MPSVWHRPDLSFVKAADEHGVLLAASGAAVMTSNTRPSMQENFDLLIRNASIVDGTGAPRFAGDIGIRGDRIACTAPTCATRPAG